VGVSIFNADNYFLVAASLLLYLDHGASHVTGKVTQNTLAAVPQPSIQENLTTAADGTITGTVTTRSARHFTIGGYVDTSHGRVETTLQQAIEFSNDQRFSITATEYVQQIEQGTRISSTRETRSRGAVALATTELSYPLSLDFSFVVNPDGSSAQTTAIAQRFDRHGTQAGGGLPAESSVSNAISNADTLLFDAAGALTGAQGQTGSQTYVARANDGTCYSRSIAAADGVLTAVTDGQGCGADHGNDH